MTPVTSFAGRKVALFGLGGSGLSTARALAAGGARVVCWDDSAPARARGGNEGLEVADLARFDFGQFESLVLAPGVPLMYPKPHWTVEKAREAGVEIIGDLELFSRERAAIAPGSPFVAITGTNGKSTTTALIAHILTEAGLRVQMGGNIGIPVLELLPPSGDIMHVLEVSSFQIDLAPSLKPGVGILINLSPDHIDRHGTMQNYAGVKARLVNGADVALVGVDDMESWKIGQARVQLGAAAGFTCPVSARRRMRQGVFVNGTRIISTLHDGAGKVLGDLADIRTLRGAHNAQNAAFAAGCADLWRVPPEVISEALRTYPGLPHRMEEVGRIGQVTFINDSKATNADATEKALLSFRDIFWIAGGQMKEGGIQPLMPLMDRVRKVYLIGAAASAFAHTLGNKVEHLDCGTLEIALIAAAQDAHASAAREPVVLLSPACASYDQFANYEARGDAFRTLTHSLVEATARAANPPVPG